MDATHDAVPSWEDAYTELKQIARARLHASGGLTQLNTTALVSETFVRWGHRMDPSAFPSKGHFFAYAARVMRSVVVDLVRERAALRRGGDWQAVTLDTQVGERLAAPSDEEVLQVDEALGALQALEPRLAEVVNMRYFAGMTEPEIAEALGLSERTVRRDWEKARALLCSMLAP
ncbi:MAG: sigma-70 family RNA polymerase sigma factor [Rubrivivax sp.]|jgi:RNA polymerase sigma factor (TIGR02999 family)|nr:sigma-70 family RNA polymerase sigma factor [Rubrivivax sp.]